MVSHLKIFSNKGCKISAQKKVFLGEFCKDWGVTQQGSGGYTAKIGRLYNKDQVVMFSDAIIKPSRKLWPWPKKWTLRISFIVIKVQKKDLVTEI